MTDLSRDFSPLLWNTDPTECYRFHMQFWWHNSVFSIFVALFGPAQTQTETKRPSAGSTGQISDRSTYYPVKLVKHNPKKHHKPAMEIQTIQEIYTYAKCIKLGVHLFGQKLLEHVTRQRTLSQPRPGDQQLPETNNSSECKHLIYLESQVVLVRWRMFERGVHRFCARSSQSAECGVYF